MITRKSRGNCFSHADTLRVNGEFTRLSSNITHLYRDIRNRGFMKSDEGQRYIEQREAATAKCFVCGKAALYKDGTKRDGIKGACAQHKDMLPNKYKQAGL